MSGVSGDAWNASAHIMDKYQEGQQLAEKRSQQQFLNNLEKQKMFNETVRTSIENTKLQNEIAELDPSMVPVFQHAQGQLNQSFYHDAIQNKSRDLDVQAMGQNPQGQMSAQDLNSQSGPQGPISLIPGQDGQAGGAAQFSDGSPVPPDAAGMNSPQMQQQGMQPAWDPRTLTGLPDGYKPFGKRDKAQLEYGYQYQKKQGDEEKFAKQSVLQLRSQRERLAQAKASAISKASADPFARRALPQITQQYDDQLAQLDDQLGQYQVQYPKLFPTAAPKTAGAKINDMIGAPKPVKAGAQQGSSSSDQASADNGGGLLEPITGRVTSAKDFYDNGVAGWSDPNAAAKASTPEEATYLNYRRAFTDYMTGKTKLQDLPSGSASLKLPAALDKIDKMVKEKKLPPDYARKLKHDLEVLDFVHGNG